MGKIPARGFITKLYSATAPTVSKYGKMIAFFFASLGSGFMHLPKHFLVVVVIFPWLLIFSPLENGEG